MHSTLHYTALALAWLPISAALAVLVLAICRVAKRRSNTLRVRRHMHLNIRRHCNCTLHL